MATANEIRAQIALTQSKIAEKRAEDAQAQADINEAIQRQQLRRELQRLQNEQHDLEFMIDARRQRRNNIDNDWAGPHLGELPVVQDKAPMSINKVHNVFQESCDHSSIIAKGEHVWKIGEMSWLVGALQYGHETAIVCDCLRLAGCVFNFQYTPAGGEEGTLAIESESCPDGHLIFRYKIFVQRRGGDFIQWGRNGSVCHPDFNDTDLLPFFGPDVPHDGGASPQGIFGLSHEELLASEWVENDTLTVRFELEVRAPIHMHVVSNEKGAKVEIPSATIAVDLASLLDSGRSSDVTFVVEGEVIKAHSQILCARSEVLDKILNGSMRESVSREVKVEDCSASTFKAVLRFLYTDDLPCMEEAMLKETPCGSQGSSSSSEGIASRASWLQSVLAISHRYTLTRLQAWCEQMLVKHITVGEVCSILCQAHLLQASQLTKMCLDFVQENHAQVIVTDSFGKLATEWPEVMLKINLHLAGIAEESARPAFEASQRAARKRKRCD